MEVKEQVGQRGWDEYPSLSSSSKVSSLSLACSHIPLSSISFGKTINPSALAVNPEGYHIIAQDMK